MGGKTEKEPLRSAYGIRTRVEVLPKPSTPHWDYDDFMISRVVRRMTKSFCLRYSGEYCER